MAGGVGCFQNVAQALILTPYISGEPKGLTGRLAHWAESRPEDRSRSPAHFTACSRTEKK